jgi:hypothetical protein
VKRRLLDLAGATVLVTAIFAALVVLQPFGRQTALHLYLLALAGLVMAAAVAALPARQRSAFDAALRRPARESRRPPELERTERTVTLGIANAFDLHARLRPLLREVATARLAARGIELDSARGRAAVGEEAWALLRADREPPQDRFEAGIDEQQLRRLLDLLESAPAGHVPTSETGTCP